MKGLRISREQQDEAILWLERGHVGLVPFRPQPGWELHPDVGRHFFFDGFTLTLRGPNLNLGPVVAIRLTDPEAAGLLAVLTGEAEVPITVRDPATGSTLLPYDELYVPLGDYAGETVGVAPPAEETPDAA